MSSRGSNEPTRARRVVISGMGCISPLGPDLAATANALRSATDAITPITSFDTSGCECHTAGQIPDAWLAAASAIVPHAHRRHRASRMFLLAVAEALAAAPGFTPDILVVGTTSGGMSFGENFYRACRERRPPSRRLAAEVRDYLPQQPVLDAAAAFGFSAPIRVLSNACASGTNALGHAFQLVRAGRARRALAGGYDALAELVFAGFDALGASTAEKCRPFSHDRTGLVLGEGAAAFLIESLDDALAAGRTPLAELTGYGDSTDNFHLTQPNPDGSGPRLAMAAALADASRSGSEIDYVNAHGTATPFNDACEARAIAAVCPNAAVSSTKGQMGHSLGAAGAIEAVFCTLALREGFLPANINFTSADADPSLDIIANTPRLSAPRTIISNSLGFGGANASLVLEAYAP